MEPLSERILVVAETEIIGADIFEKWATEVAALESHIEELEKASAKRKYDLAKARTLKSDFIALWKLACPCGVITAADREEWDRLQDVGAALAALDLHPLVGEEKP